MTKLLLTPAEAAELLGVGRTTIYELMNSGDIPSVRIGRARRIPSADLVAFVDRLRGVVEQGEAA
ncbi:transcriptional regulator [Parafrankia colletiae]|uniref:Transcriptional regulator n=1 Tax=Parafrankia colletiae TaxID=573497 RepID=A0A1S1R026_9ACTN|nr:helix-turn-helix domain-containing protein [Parafrankia colletiae]MCK9899107.1 helix-turn-helix domain-containing protein [Frankia sp. Cpl3]OHV38672.1 transcriptional regulator [Parafrankia colletiae]